MTVESLANAVNYPFAHQIEPIVVFAILLFTYSSIIIFLAVIILRLRKNQFEKRAEFIKASLNGLIMGAAFASTEEELNEILFQAKPEFSKYIKTSSQGQIVRHRPALSSSPAGWAPRSPSAVIPLN